MEPKNKKGGFRYYLASEQLEEYKRWPLERRLMWLFLANKMRRSLPKEIINIQDAFRRGELGL